MIPVPMGSRPDYYGLLHVRSDAPIEIIRSSYRTLMKTLGAHPDLGGDGSDARALNEAWKTLSDRDERARYDAERALADARSRVEPEPPREPAPATACADEAPAEPARDRSDRRTTTRLKRDARITWSIKGGKSHTSTISDLSPQGLSFVTQVQVRLGEALDVQSDAFRGRSIVRNVRHLDDGRILVGVQFESVRFHENRGSFISRSA